MNIYSFVIPIIFSYIIYYSIITPNTMSISLDSKVALNGNYTETQLTFVESLLCQNNHDHWETTCIKMLEYDPTKLKDVPLLTNEIIKWIKSKPELFPDVR